MSGMTIEQLRERARGAVIERGDDGYDEARVVYNAMIDRRPRVVVRCSDVGDVIAAVDFARENGLDLAIRGGGHSVPGFGTVDDGVVADLSGMLCPPPRTARSRPFSRAKSTAAMTSPASLQRTTTRGRRSIIAL